MDFLIFIKSAPAYADYHAYIVETVRALCIKNHKIRAVFFSDAGACIASKNYTLSSVQKQIQDMYQALKKDYGIELLCCGQAFRSLGLLPKDLHEDFTLSGNLELSQYFCACEVVQF